MAQYYYAVTSLPQLLYESEHYSPVDEFLDLCRENRSAGDLRAVLEAERLARSDSWDTHGKGAAILEGWNRWNRSLRADLAVLRSQALGREPEQLPEVERLIGTEEIARETFSQESPLTAEETIERRRWALLDEMEVGHYFDLQKLIVYMLRLTILERKAQFSTDSGLVNFTIIYETITKEQIGDEPESTI